MSDDWEIVNKKQSEKRKQKLVEKSILKGEAERQAQLQEKEALAKKAEYERLYGVKRKNKPKNRKKKIKSPEDFNFEDDFKRLAAARPPVGVTVKHGERNPGSKNRVPLSDLRQSPGLELSSMVNQFDCIRAKYHDRPDVQLANLCLVVVDACHRAQFSEPDEFVVPFDRRIPLPLSLLENDDVDAHATSSRPVTAIHALLSSDSFSFDDTHVHSFCWLLLSGYLGLSSDEAPEFRGQLGAKLFLQALIQCYPEALVSLPFVNGVLARCTSESSSGGHLPVVISRYRLLLAWLAGQALLGSRLAPDPVAASRAVAAALRFWARFVLPSVRVPDCRPVDRSDALHLGSLVCSPGSLTQPALEAAQSTALAVDDYARAVEQLVLLKQLPVLRKSPADVWRAVDQLHAVLCCPSALAVTGYHAAMLRTLLQLAGNEHDGVRNASCALFLDYLSGDVVQAGQLWASLHGQQATGSVAVLRFITRNWHQRYAHGALGVLDLRAVCLRLQSVPLDAGSSSHKTAKRCATVLDELLSLLNEEIGKRPTLASTVIYPVLVCLLAVAVVLVRFPGIRPRHLAPYFVSLDECTHWLHEAESQMFVFIKKHLPVFGF